MRYDKIIYATCTGLWRHTITLGILFIQALRPLLGPRSCCLTEPSCLKFAQKHLATKPFTQALPAIILRLLCCQPFFWYFKYCMQRRD